MNYNEAMQYIESLGKFGIHLGMERITGLVELLDHPERKIRTIHITGTNGKGSVASYLSHILTASGKKTACYTSPHFVKYNERMSIDGVDISDEDFAAVTEETKAAVDTFLKNGGEQPKNSGSGFSAGTVHPRRARPQKGVRRHGSLSQNLFRSDDPQCILVCQQLCASEALR